MKRFLMMILACMMMLSAVSCRKTETPPTTDSSDAEKQSSESVEQESSDTTGTEDSEQGSEDEENPIVHATYPLADVTESLKLIGRVRAEGSGLICDFAASGIEFRAYLEGEVALSVTSTAASYYTVYIDGVRSEERLSAAKGESRLVLASFAQGGEHTVRVLRQTEPIRSLSVLNSLEMTGYWLARPKNSTTYIEFVGDSITSGYGNLCANGAADPGSALNSDGTQTYAYLCAEKLGADASLVSCTGIGVLAGHRDFVMEDYYGSFSYYRSKTEKFTSRRTPDVVVVNLGTNDLSKQANPTEFVKKVKDLVAQIRDVYGMRVTIVWAYNMMGDGMNGHVKTALDELGGESAGLYMCSLIQDPSGGGGHPSLSAHKTAAEQLATFLQEKNLVR